jgi:hypothetical protein
MTFTHNADKPEPRINSYSPRMHTDEHTLHSFMAASSQEQATLPLVNAGAQAD